MLATVYCFVLLSQFKQPVFKKHIEEKVIWNRRAVTKWQSRKQSYPYSKETEEDSDEEIIDAV